MAYYVDKVVICDAFREPDRHYRLLPGGRSELTEGRRPSMRFLATNVQVRRGIQAIAAATQPDLFDEGLDNITERNEFINDLREKVREWREQDYRGTARVTRRLLEWWFERDEERSKELQRFFFGQREAIETIVYLYEVESRYRMPETGDLLRYAIKLATGAGKTTVMALLIVWSSLHKRKVAGSTLTENFLVLVPNLTVRDRVSGENRGDGLFPEGACNVYKQFDMVPPEYVSEFHPRVRVRNWQSIQLNPQPEDAISEGELYGDGRFIPASVLRALQRRQRTKDPNSSIRRLLGNVRDVMVLNDEAHHVYGEKKGKKGEEADYIKWTRIIHRIGEVATIPLVVDLSATPWYGSGSPKPGGTLFEWIVSDFSVYDAFESGLVKVVRLPDPTEHGAAYIDIWENVRHATTEADYVSECRGALESIYSSWKKEFEDWHQDLLRLAEYEPSPAMLVVASDAKRAGWLFNHITKQFPEMLGNDDPEDVTSWHTIQIDSKVFEGNGEREKLLREMVNTVGKKGALGERVRCIVSVNMLSEGWDVKSITHILGIRAFGSPLLTEQIIGRGLRRVHYDHLYTPVDQRREDNDEFVDAFGIPFVGFPVQRRKRPKAGVRGGKSTWIAPDPEKEKHRVRVPNVLSWAVALSEPLSQVIEVDTLKELVIDGRQTPPIVKVKPVVGANPEDEISLEAFRSEFPLLRSKMIVARELFESMNPEDSELDGLGPTFEEIFELVDAYVDRRVRAVNNADKRDIAIAFWLQQARNSVESAIRNAKLSRRNTPIMGEPAFCDTAEVVRFSWSGLTAPGKRSHLSCVACATQLEADFSNFLDHAKDVIRYAKNERFHFTITWFDNGRPRQYHPDFVVVVKGQDGREEHWIAEPKGELRPSTWLKKEAAEAWCAKMSTTKHGLWRYLLVQETAFEHARPRAAKFSELASILLDEANQ